MLFHAIIVRESADRRDPAHGRGVRRALVQDVHGLQGPRDLAERHPGHARRPDLLGVPAGARHARAGWPSCTARTWRSSSCTRSRSWPPAARTPRPGPTPGPRSASSRPSGACASSPRRWASSSSSPTWASGSAPSSCARRRGARGRVATESCPHYLAFDKDTDRGVQGKVNPPLRGRDHIDGALAAADRRDRRRDGLRPLPLHEGGEGRRALGRARRHHARAAR